MDEKLAEARQRLGDEAYEAARRGGSAMPLGERVVVARAMGSAADGTPGVPTG